MYIVEQTVVLRCCLIRLKAQGQQVDSEGFVLAALS
jgi:hypothetical protein